MCRLKSAGAVLVAKLVTGSLAYDDIWFGGRTRNPWNIEEFSTGSSAGPAACTSAGCQMRLMQSTKNQMGVKTERKREVGVGVGVWGRERDASYDSFWFYIPPFCFPFFDQ